MHATLPDFFSVAHSIDITRCTYSAAAKIRLL